MPTSHAFSVNKKSGFTLIELLVVIVIISILAVVSVVLFTNVSKGARDSRRQQDIIAIAKGYENNALVGKYRSLAPADFSSGKIPTDPNTSRGDGTGNYYNVMAADGSWFKACAALDNNPNQYCNNTSNNCFCKPSSQGTVNASTEYTGTGSQIGITPTVSCPSSLSSNLAGYWRMDESSGSTANDSSGQGNNGTLNGPTWQLAANCQLGSSCLNFNGTNNYVAVNYNSLFNIGNSFTLTAWVYLPSINPGPIISTLDVEPYPPFPVARTKGYALGINTSFLDGQNPNSLMLQFGKDNWGWNIYTSAANSITASPPWKHVAVTVANVNTASPAVTFYINDAASTATFWSGSPRAAIYWGNNASSNRIGSRYTAGDPTYSGGPAYFSGRLDDVRIYNNRVLSPGDITSLYNSGSGCTQ